MKQKERDEMIGSAPSKHTRSLLERRQKWAEADCLTSLFCAHGLSFAAVCLTSGRLAARGEEQRNARPRPRNAK
jgi:hypothetical protein